MKPGRLAMIGLDAADLGFIRLNADELPNLRSVLARSSLMTIRSTADLLTGSVWPTFATATNPGEHGLYHHLQWDAKSMRMRRVIPDWIEFEPFWHDLARRGRRVIAIDVPLTYPQPLRDGVAVYNWGSHDQIGPVACHPRRLENEMRRRFGGHPMGIEIPVGKSVEELEKIRDDLVRGARRKGALVRWVVDQFPWDFLITVFGETHRGGHILWPDGPGGETIPAGALLDVYRAVDAAVGDILASPSLADAGVIVFALHGMGPNLSQEHFVPEVMDRVNAGFPGHASTAAGNATGRPPRGRGRGIVRRLRERVPASIQNRIARLVPVSVRDEVVNRSVVGGHDWASTQGFDLAADMYGYLRLNLRGRERDGALERDGDVLPRYVAWVRECFDSLRIAGTGERLVGAIQWTGDVYPGPRLDHLPDLVVTWTGQPPAERIESDLVGSVSAQLATGRSGNHRTDGFCAISGAGLDPQKLADGRDLAALAMRAME